LLKLKINLVEIGVDDMALAVIGKANDGLIGVDEGGVQF